MLLKASSNSSISKVYLAEAVVFKRLLEHVFDEKIVNSTVKPKNGSYKKPDSVESVEKEPELTTTEEIINKSKPEIRDIAQTLPPQVNKRQTDDPIERFRR